MPTLFVIADELLAHRGPVARYTERLVRGLLESAPGGVSVAAGVSSRPEPEYDRVRSLLPGIASLEKSALTRRQLEWTWRRGVAVPGGPRMLHAPSLLAPLRRHDRAVTPGDQSVVTIHDALPWTHPELLPSGEVSHRRALARRAERYADAVVVPTHAVAERLAQHLALGARVRVIPPGIAAAGDMEPRAAAGVPADVVRGRPGRRPARPDRYLVALASGPASRLSSAIGALRAAGMELPLLVPDADGDSLRELADRAGVDPARVVAAGALSSAELAGVLAHAAAVIVPASDGSAGHDVLEALSAGVPVIASDDDAVAELSGGAALTVPLARGGFASRLGEAIAGVLEDAGLADRLAVAARDRTRAFGLADAARQVWQLHADL